MYVFFNSWSLGGEIAIPKIGQLHMMQMIFQLYFLESKYFQEKLSKGAKEENLIL